MRSDMRKLFYILLISSIFNISVKAENPQGRSLRRMTFGLEYGYVAAVHSAYHYYFFAPEGYRVDDRGQSFRYTGNTEMYLHMGYNPNSDWNLSLYAGYAGLERYHDAIPVSIRATRYFGNDPDGDRWFSFADIGSGICLKKPVQEILTGKIGGGYRLSLSKFTKIDLILSARMTYTHPQITYDGTIIPMDKTNRNNAYITSLSCGIRITI